MRAEYQASAIIQTELSGRQKQKKRKEGEEAGNVRKNSLHVGGVNVAQSLARNIFLVPLYLSSESFNTKLHPFEKL